MRKNPKKNLRRSNTSATNICYHIIWTTKYRKPLLTDVIQLKLKEFLKIKCDQLQIVLKALEIMSNHIHIFIQSSPLLSVSFIVKHLKGFTSFKLRKSFVELNLYKHLWTPSYYCESIGHINQATVIKYINDQKKIILN